MIKRLRRFLYDLEKIVFVTVYVLIVKFCIQIVSNDRKYNFGVFVLSTKLGWAGSIDRENPAKHIVCCIA